MALAACSVYRKPVIVVHTHFFNVPVDKAWEINQDFELFHKVMLRNQTLPLEPKWVAKGPGEIGGELEFTLMHQGTVCRMIERVLSMEKTAKGGYSLHYEIVSTRPALPIHDYRGTWELVPTPNGGTRVLWTRQWDNPWILGLIPVGGIMKDGFIRSARVVFDNVQAYYGETYPSRLPKKGDKVLIVGAGPSGLHMAHLLTSKGYTDITILEKTDRYGGKTVTIKDQVAPETVHELGTCYLHPAYYAVRALFEEIKKMPGATEPFEEVAPDVYTVRMNGRADLGFDEWVTSNLQLQPKYSAFALSRIMFPYEDAAVEIILAKDRYNLLHEQIFGDFNFTMPPPLTTESLKLLDKSFVQFLEENDLMALLPVLAYGQTCQGYGTIEATPAFWAMCWVTPQLLDQYFALKPQYPKKAMLKHGWISLWDEIVKLNKLNIRYHVDIERITRTPADGKTTVRVVGKEKGTPIDETYDFLVMGAPVFDDQGKAFLDVNEEEGSTFKTNMEHGQFRTVLFRTKAPQPYLKSHLTIYASKIIGADAGQGEVFAWRDSYLALRPNLCTDLQAHEEDPERVKIREQMAYQYVENNYNLSEEVLEGKFLTWAENRFGSQDNYEVLFKQTWDYSARFNSVGLTNRDPWRILSFQGKNATLFVHASTFFESVLDIVNYNNMLYDSLTGKFNTIDEHPPEDKKPIPEDSQSFRARNIAFRVFFTLITFILNIVWTLYYILMAPLNRLFIYPLQRYYLQKAFKTENIGWWFTMSLRKFINVSPSVICFIKDVEDPVLTTLNKEADWSKFPGIPKVKWAIQWNYQDYRVMVTEWQRIIQPTAMSFIGPGMMNFFRKLRFNSPIIYNWIFSWIAAVAFTNITGYGYRVDDERGGGFYVPKCEMLDVARQDHGVEIGDRVCTHVCKIFTEEYMKTKGLDCVLEPDLVKGSCMIRGLPFRGTACSDNSTYEW